MSAQLWGIADLEPFGSVSRSDAFAIPSYFCVYSLPPSHVFHIVFFFLENLNAEVLHLIGLILVVPIQGFNFCYSVLLFKGLADLTSPDLQVTIFIWVVVYIFFCFLLCRTLYKLLMVGIVHDCFIVVCYIVHTFSPPFCWKWKLFLIWLMQNHVSLVNPIYVWKSTFSKPP